MSFKILFVALFSFLVFPTCYAQDGNVETIPVRKMETIIFKSLEGVEVEADYYFSSELRKGIIVLCHQAGWSRGEYNEIAPKLLLMGYDCIAIDQRSGGEVNDVINNTAKKATELNQPTGFLDAEQDIIAAIRWAKGNNKGEEVILWGSSYSASLVLKVAQDEGVDKVLSFSPGEYFGDKLNLKAAIDELEIPVFITCSKKEIEKTQEIFDIIPSKHKTFFKPKTDGNHGSRALWIKFDDNYEYWDAVRAFLNNN